MPPASYNPSSSSGDFAVQVLDEARLRSELAVFIWAQTETWRSRPNAASEAPGADLQFKDAKRALTDAVLGLAGQTIARSELIELLKRLIGEGQSPGLHGLDPKTLASKISVRARA